MKVAAIYCSSGVAVKLFCLGDLVTNSPPLQCVKKTCVQNKTKPLKYANYIFCFNYLSNLTKYNFVHSCRRDVLQ